MSRIGVERPDGSVYIVGIDDGNDAPWCDGPGCYMHSLAPEFDEHHVEPCPAYGTMQQAAHRLGEAAAPVVVALRAELGKTRRGRITLWLLDVRSWLSSKRRRLYYRRWRLSP